MAPIAEPLVLERLDAGVAVVSAPTPIALGAARTRRTAIEDALSKAAGRTIRLELRAADVPASSPPATANVPDTAARAQAMNNPLVRRAVELFNATVVDVQDEPGAA